MRVLLAVDGSHGAEVAHALVKSLPWPGSTHIDLLRVIEPAFDAFLLPDLAAETTAEDLLGAAEVEHPLDADAAALVTPTRTVATHVTVGRAASCIVESAERLGSDLIVMGSRGRGPIAAMVLGSVSAEVADHAPCPVLVARVPTCRRAIVALDGTPFTDHVVDAVGDFTFLHETPIDVISIAPSSSPGPGVVLSAAYGMPSTWYEEGVDTTRHNLEQVASTAAQSLRGRGLLATWAVHQGDPAGTLIDLGQRMGADLLIVGTHGRTGVTRLLLGSVARNVLLHAHASVLVLREAKGTDHEVVHHAAMTAG